MTDNVESGESSSNRTATIDLKGYLDEQFQHIRREFSHSLSAASVGSLKQVVFTRRGNRLQHEFNVDILGEVERIAVISGDSGPVSDICNVIKRKITQRNKLIKFADKSSAGWSTVNEYIDDEVASDSEDSRRIRKAEKSALSKIQLAKEKFTYTSKRNDRFAPYVVRSAGVPSVSPPPPGVTYTVPVSGGFGRVGGTFRRQQHFGGQQPFGGQLGGQQPFGGQQTFGRQFKSWQQCFKCGGFGHWRRECTSYGGAQAEQTARNTVSGPYRGVPK